MRLLSVHISNFKLLEDVEFRFSPDSQRPLTVIRAENGSGKTSFINALLWAFYGMEGLPSFAQGLRLTSSAAPAGQPVDVSVMVEFEHTDDKASRTSYRLIRTVSEIPTAGDTVNRGNDRVRLLRITAAGEEDIQPADALIAKFVPSQLRQIFFTNGDDMQTFITGRIAAKDRQRHVHKAIEALLGLNTLKTAASDIELAYKNIRAEAAKSAGADVEAAEKALEEANARVAELTKHREEIDEQLANMNDRKAEWEKELTGLRGIGDIDELNSKIEDARSSMVKLEAMRARSLLHMRDALESEECSWALLGNQLNLGIGLLSDLADRHVIPGTSLEVLTDRLEIGICVCGEPLAPGSAHREAVERLREEQRKTSDTQQRLTGLFHTARQSSASHIGRTEDGNDYAHMRVNLLQEFTEARDLLRDRGLELKMLEGKRAQINEERVRQLNDQLSRVELQISEGNTNLGATKAKLDQQSEILQAREEHLREAELATRVSRNVSMKRSVAEDLHTLVRKTLEILEGDYVRRVSDRMNELFMNIVGSDAEFEAGVFKGVHVADSFDIIIDTYDGRQLDPDFELNGASQRALTLSFIWALMEVSGATGPRIIDSPLGMVAGGVKTRMVDIITRPASGALLDFQVILLLTRSEIRDIETLIDERAGRISTLSCSKDYPEDLVYSWGSDHPLIKACECIHTQSCRLCARRYDKQHGVTFLDEVDA